MVQFQLQRLVSFCLYVVQGVLEAVPLAYRIEQRQCGQGCHGQRQVNLQQYLEVIRAVNDGCFFQFVGQCLEKALQDDHVIGAQHTWENQCPGTVHQAQFFDVQVMRDNTAGEIHREQCQEAEEVTPAQAFLCQRISHQDRHDHGEQGIYNRNNDREHEAARHALIGEDRLVCCGFKIHRPEAHVAAQDSRLGTEGYCRHVYERKQARQAEENNDNRQDNLCRCPDLCFLDYDLMLIRSNDFLCHLIHLLTRCLLRRGVWQ